MNNYNSHSAYYRLKVQNENGQIQYTQTIRLDLTKKTEFTISPVPAANYLQLSIPCTRSGEVKLSIVGASGQIVRMDKMNLRVGTNVFTLDYISSLRPGTYLISVTTEEGTQWKKFMVADTPKL